MNKKLILISALLLFAFNGWTEDLQPPKDCYEDLAEEPLEYYYEDYCIYESRVGNITTIDIRIKPEGNQTVFDIPYANLRYAGAIIQIYYSSMVFGKSQWILMPDSRGVYIHPNSISLPIDEWIEDGFPINSFIRVVFLTHENSSKNLVQSLRLDSASSR